jgi:hypothetical protein
MNSASSNPDTLWARSSLAGQRLDWIGTEASTASLPAWIVVKAICSLVAQRTGLSRNFVGFARARK